MPRNQGTSRKGKPKKNERAAGMGRSLQKSGRPKHIPSASTGGMARRQGVESLNIQKEDNRASVLDVNDLDDFLIQAEMANREFASQKERFVMLDSTAQQATEELVAPPIPWEKGGSTTTGTAATSSTTTKKSKTAFAFQELSVPRRPAWDETTTPEELDRRENEAFLEWRRAIAKREEEIVLSQDMNSSVGVTPFEKNLEIWRQLWRVMERVSCIVQIVDARNPLFYLSKDLKAYATEELGKPMLLLINKSDYLTPLQRKAWHEYFSDPEHPWEHVFFSAHEQQAALDRRAAEEHQASEDAAALAAELLNLQEEADDEEGDDNDSNDVGDENPADDADSDHPEHEPQPVQGRAPNLGNIGVESPLTREELLDWLWDYATKNKCEEDPKYDRIPFGMVGFPNVGKSSVINVLMGNAKFAHGVVRVAVAAQPGKTKHFQTLLLPDREKMLLCDCPGLVFPSFVSNTADLIAAGVYPIAQMRDPFPVVNLLCRRIPRQVLNAHYGIQIPMPTPDAMLAAPPGTIPPPTVEEFLTTYCVARSMLASSSGVPDFQRASRIVIKEYAVGKLLYCHAPPNFDDDLFQKETLSTAIRNTKKLREKLLKDTTFNLDEDEKRDLSESQDESEGDSDSDVEEDEMLLELLGDSNIGGRNSDNAAKPTNKAARPKKWGKKGRKLRNKDPYGCHSTPDESLSATDGPLGVTVKAGKKHTRKDYVRPTGYGMTTSRVVLG